jgi:uncharacterized protein YbjT (DUF2867 family)
VPAAAPINMRLKEHEKRNETKPAQQTMKIIVNSGNIGTPVALELARLGAEVTLCVRNPKPNATWDDLGIRQAAFDINDRVSMTKALDGGEAFFSLTPLVENLPEAGIKAIEAAKLAGIRKIVRCSAQGAGPDAAIQLGRMHYAVEKAVEDSGIPFTLLRPANFMQNYISFGAAKTIKSEDAFYSPMGEARISPIDTRDITSAATRVLMESGHEGKRYDLTGAESLSDGEIAGIFSEALGRRVAHINITQLQAKEAMAGAGIPGWLVEVLGELNEIVARGYLAAVMPDTEMLLDRKPILFSQFVHDHLEAFRAV